ncbi:UNVERIFIED_CONTAM: Endoplasmic reticulum resident protein 44, partial [Eudyptes robustus]
TKADVVILNNENFDGVIANNKLVFVNFYAEWCRFSQILKPIFESASQNFKDNANQVAFGSVDCDKQPVIAQRFKVNKYPTLKLFRHGQLVKKEYRGQRSVDAFTDFIKKQIESTVKHISEEDNLDTLLDGKSRNIIGYFNAPQGEEYNNFQKIASVLRDECHFYIGIGEWSKKKNIAGNHIVFRDRNGEKEFNGPIAGYQHLLDWANSNCVPLIREITFENAEELTEEGIPFLILFRTLGDKKSEEEFASVVLKELGDQKSSVNVLMADGKKFAHPLYHLGKKESDLPVIAIDSFRHMFPFSSFNDIFIPGNLRQFVEDLHSGKLHREYHHGPDKQSPPPESVFNKLKPSDNRYSLLKDEL